VALGRCRTNSSRIEESWGRIVIAIIEPALPPYVAEKLTAVDDQPKLTWFTA
jgi:hypothetical protein